MKSMNKTMKYIENNLLYLVLIAQPLLDILAYLQGGDSTSVSGYLRLVLTLVIPMYTLIVIKSKRNFIAIMCIIAGFSVLHIANGFRVGYISFFGDVKYLLLVIHMPILLFSFMYLYEKKSILDQIIRAIKSIVIIVVVAFYVSLITKTGNYTYADAEMGWTGWYIIPNAQSVIMSSLLPFILYYVLKYFKKWFPISMIVISYIYISNGTKAAYLSLILVYFVFAMFMIFEYFVKRKGKFPVYNVLMLLALLVVVVGVYRYSPRAMLDGYAAQVREEEQSELDEVKEEEDEEEEEKLYVESINPLLLKRFGKKSVFEAYGDDATAYEFADMRLKKLIYGTLVWKESDIITKCVGFQYPEMQFKGENFDLENDPHAILFYYGYIGATLYIVLLGYFVLRLIRQLIIAFRDSLNLFNFVILISLVLQLGLAVYTGYLLRRPNVAIYLMISLLLIHCQCDDLRKGREI